MVVDENDSGRGRRDRTLLLVGEDLPSAEPVEDADLGIPTPTTHLCHPPLPILRSQCHNAMKFMGSAEPARTRTRVQRIRISGTDPGAHRPEKKPVCGLWVTVLVPCLMAPGTGHWVQLVNSLSRHCQIADKPSLSCR